jgi:hypothetical protein
MVLGASRQHIDFVTALGEALGGLAHDSLRTAHYGISIPRCHKGDASLAGGKSHFKCSLDH